MQNLSYTVTANWLGGRAGSGSFESQHLRERLAGPTELGGTGAGTNPEELLVAAAASCLLLTFAAFVERYTLPVSKVELASKGDFESTTRLRIVRIVHNAVLWLEQGPDSDQAQSTLNMLRRAEQACMVSTAIRNNVEVGLDAVVKRAEHPS
ncbi:MAG TPA: OsmC family protein [Polyangiaceae bacterium]|nr:OsmC family protein [Polyangiaceae bacterium]